MGCLYECSFNFPYSYVKTPHNHPAGLTERCVYKLENDDVRGLEFQTAQLKCAIAFEIIIMVIKTGGWPSVDAMGSIKGFIRVGFVLIDLIF